MDKLYDRIIWENDTTPALNEDNLNAMSKAIDDIDDRVVYIAAGVYEVIPELEELLEDAEQIIADTKGYAESAEASATAAGLSEDNAEDSAEDAEAWAVGKRNGVDVPSSDPAYHNNAKYWSEQANPTTFASMTDVDFNNLQNGQVPVWDSTAQKWKNGAGGGGGGTSANQVSYTNTTSGLSATNVQDAIDEVDGRLDTAESKLSSVKISSAVSCVTGDTSATIQDAAIATTSIIEPFIDDGTGVPIPATSITTTTGQTVIAFAALERGANIKVRITN